MSRKRQAKLIIELVIAWITLLLLSGSSVFASALRSPSLQDGNQVVAGLDLRLSVSPVASEPGDSFSLTLTLTNHRIEMATPEVQLIVPDFLTLDSSNLPSGTTFNFQDKTLGWQPVLNGNGGTAQLMLKLIIDVVDLRTPEKSVSAILRDGEQEQQVSTTFWVGVLPQASIRFDPPTAAVGQSVRLISTVTGPGPISQRWHLGDGRDVNVPSPEVIYSIPGTYTITLQASNPLGESIAYASLDIIPQPMARFTIANLTPYAGDAVDFINHSGGLSPLEFYWDFGDGNTSSEPNPTHSFATQGIYNVRLTVVNELGQSETTLPLQVGGNPVADMMIQESGIAGQVISGQVFTDDTVVRIIWDMGDGTTYEGEFVNHVYWALGDYLVTLTVYNEYGHYQENTWVRIRPGVLYLYLPLVQKDNGDEMSSLAPPVLSTAPDSGASGTTEDIALDNFALPDTLTPAERLLAYMNEARRINNLRPLNYVYELSIAAQAHSDDMALNEFTGHQGSDGSTPPFRIQVAGYPGGYGGEATAWGMDNALSPVKFWLASPEHRQIILNPAVTDVGIGFSQNYESPNIWYWTAEFASLGLPVVEVSPLVPTTPEVTVPPTIQLLGPPQHSEFALAADNQLIFTWSWPEPLEANQRFAVYLKSSLRTYQIGVVREPSAGGQYQYKVLASDVPAAPGLHQWQVRLEDSRLQSIIFESALWTISFVNPSATQQSP